jgi:hypothetical protein
MYTFQFASPRSYFRFLRVIFRIRFTTCDFFLAFWSVIPIHKIMPKVHPKCVVYHQSYVLVTDKDILWIADRSIQFWNRSAFDIAFLFSYHISSIWKNTMNVSKMYLRNLIPRFLWSSLWFSFFWMSVCLSVWTCCSSHGDSIPSHAESHNIHSTRNS